MTRKLIWTGIVLGLIPLYMGAACGGYIGWPGLSTSGGDAKVTEELSISSTNPLEAGLWTYYVQYNNIGQQNMKTVSTFRDGTAPFGVFTSDGNLQQHFSDHVGVQVAAANDRNGDGVICWIGCGTGAGDYTIPNAFCPAVGGTGSTSASNGFQAYCNKGVWETIVSSGQFEETKSSSPGSKYSNSLGNGSNFSPTVLGQILATSQLNSKTGALTVTVNGLSLPSGASHTLTTPITFNLFGYWHGLAINTTQAGMVEAANWLASQWAGQPDGNMNVTVTMNGGAAASYLTLASGNSAAIALQNFAATH
jgi:hypothetical protein